MRIVGLTLTGVIVLACLIAVSSAAARSGAGDAGQTAARYPNGIAVLGHSGATGENSDPSAPPRHEARENSWATGTNPAVKSLYLRLLALNPRIKGNNFNLAQGGANVLRLYKQATIAVPKLSPRPDLFVIQIMDNDVRCDGSNIPKFQSTLVSVLKVLAKGPPNTRIFIVSQFGSPATYAASLTLAQRKQFGGGSGPCDFIDSAGDVIPERVANLESAIQRYEAALAAACKRVAICRYDGGAFSRIVDRVEYLSSDLNHFSIKGHAKAAAVAWEAMKRTGVIPRG